jgi:hypothetical protein
MEIIGVILFIGFWIFMGTVTGTILVNKCMKNSIGPDEGAPLVALGAIFWPITLLCMAGIYVGDYFTGDKK